MPVLADRPSTTRAFPGFEIPSFTSSFFQDLAGDRDTRPFEMSAHEEFARMYIEDMSEFLSSPPDQFDVLAMLETAITGLDRPMDMLDPEDLQDWGGIDLRVSKQVLQRRGPRLYVPLHQAFMSSIGHAVTQD